MTASLQVPLQITIRDVARSEALEAHIREKAAKLEKFHPRITRCRVTVEELRKHHHQGRHSRVRIDVRVPGHVELVANRDHDEDVYVALRDAFDHMARQLEDVVREQRGDVKAHELPQGGKVTRLFTDIHIPGFGYTASPLASLFPSWAETIIYHAVKRARSDYSIKDASQCDIYGLGHG